MEHDADRKGSHDWAVFEPNDEPLWIQDRPARRARSLRMALFGADDLGGA